MASIMPDRPLYEATRSTATVRIAPLLDLLRTTLREHGHLTLRLLPADEVDASHNPRLTPHARLMELPEDFDDARLLSSLVYGLYILDLTDADPRLERAVHEFAQDATGRTVAAMGVVAR